MKTTIVCGLLGAGKTTFIRHFTKTLPGKTVVLVNDFGKTGIDGEIFSAGGIDAIELPSGCVCCTLKADLITTIRKIREEFAPEHLIIEPSGIASPSGVLEALDVLQVNPAFVIGLVDAREFLELCDADMYGRFFTDQIKSSDIILVNKSDLVTPELLHKTIERTADINPSAIIYHTVMGALDEPLTDMPLARQSTGSPPARLRFETLSVLLPDGIVFSSLERFFDELAEGMYGKIIRAKALANTDCGAFRFDLSFHSLNIEPFSKKADQGRLVLIGEDIKNTTVVTRFSG